MESFNTYPLKIRYSDTDQMGIVHNSVYAVYCEIGRTELCAAHGLPYHEMERDGIFMMVAEMGGRFRRAIRYGEGIAIRVSVSRLRPKLVSFDYEIFHVDSNEICYTGFSKHLFSTDRKSTCELPDKYFSIFKKVIGLSGEQIDLGT